MTSVHIGIPTYGGVEPEFLASLLAGVLVCREVGIEVEADIVSNCSLIAKARNEIAARFLSGGRDCLLFLDADLHFKAEDMVRLIQRPEAVIGSAYVKKDHSGIFVCNPVRPYVEQDGAWEVEGIGTGFLRIKREALEGMDVPTYGPEQTRAFFNCGIVDGEYMGEDYAFCREYRRQGGRVWMLPAEIGHVGKHTYRGKQ